MKKTLLNSTLFVCLVAGSISLWIVANPLAVHAASSSATCANGEIINCSGAASNCIGVDSTPSTSGYCLCTAQNGGAQTALKLCIDIDEDPPLND
jgi:hypothetical protein